MEVNDLKAKVSYYCRERLFHSMQEGALEGLKRFPGNATFQLYNGLALVLGSKPAEGLRELEALQREPDVMLGAIVAMQWAHNRAGSADKEAIATLDSRLKLERKRAGEAGLYHAAIVLVALSKPTKAGEYADRLIKSFPDSVDGLVAKAWTELSGPRPLNAARYLDAALEGNRRNVDATFAKAKLLECGKDYDGAIVIVSQLAGRFPSFAGPLVEKMKLQLATRNWDAALETAARILGMDPSCLEALRIKVLSLVVKEASYEEAGLGLRRLFAETEKREPENANVFLENAVLFSRVCGGNTAVLTETFRFAERAAKLDPASADAAAEMGHQCLLQGRTKEAVRFFRGATKVDESSMAALMGLTMCQLQDAGCTPQAKQQIEFLREVQASSPSASVLLMSAQLESGNADKALPLLDSAVSAHMAALQDLPFGPKYLAQLDPGLLLRVVREYSLYPSSNQSLPLLETLSTACPGLVPALQQLAALRLARGDLAGAAQTLTHILDDVDAASVDAHLLMAQVHVARGDFARAEQSLERGVSFNFSVRERPVFHMISALVAKSQGDLPRCIATLRTALAAPAKTGSATGKQDNTGLSLSERAGLHLELAEALRVSGQVHEATAALEAAGIELSGTPEEGRLAVAHAELALMRQDTQAAIAVLDTVKPGHPYYNQACCKMAEIHLKHRKDKRAFSECYREMVEASPDATTFSQLGDAYISIQEPDLAIEAYEQALKRNPSDTTLRCKTGKALVRCHLYTKAIAYYQDAVKDETSGVQLRLDLADLHSRLGQHELAESVLTQQLQRNGADDFADRTRLLTLLARVREKAGHTTAALSALRDARENQVKVLKRSDTKENRSAAAEICTSMARLAEGLRDNEAAIGHFKDALGFKAGDTDVLVALAKLYMQANDLEQCQMSCMLLLNADPAHEPAMVMMADLAFRKVDFETAAFHFQQLLAKRPDYWTALARLVEVLRRMGRLSEAAPFLSRAELATVRPNQEAGLCYCRGLYEWYGGQRNSALKLFNGARQDTEWGQQAVYNMVKICLSSEDDMLGFAADDDEGFGGAREMTMRMAEQLLHELKPKPGAGRDQALRHRLLGNFLLLASGARASADRAMMDFTTLAGQEAYQDHVGVAYGIAVTYMAMKQTPRARNQLKRVAKYRWTFEDADYLESCWILLADIYIQNGKYDMAGELVKRVLQHNKGSAKAYEYSGLIAEKEQGHREAALLYEQAWKFGGKANPAIGFKLALNHLKSKRFADAIDVCQAVLKDFPEYPRIRKDVLDKARNNLRT